MTERRMRLGQSLMMAIAVVVAIDSHAEELPIPDAATSDEALEVVREIYSPDYESIQTPGQQAALARKLLADALETDDPTDRYVMFREARDLARQVGDIYTVFAAISAIGRDFGGDPLAMKAATVIEIAEERRHPAERWLLLAHMRAVVEEAVAADRFQTAREVMDTARKLVRLSRDPRQLNQVDEVMHRVEVVESAYNELQPARAVLETKPTDPAANFKIGRFRCFLKGDWAGGIPMLALGGDGPLAQLAIKELARTSTSVDLGNDWWAIADQLNEREKPIARQRATRWYLLALDLAGRAERQVILDRMTLAYPPRNLQGVANGVMFRGPKAAAMDAPRLPVKNTFDSRQSWSLYVEIVPRDFEESWQMICMWGDTRGGHDALHIRQERKSLDFLWEDVVARQNSELRIEFDVPLGEKRRVQVDHDPATRTMRMYLDGKLVAAAEMKHQAVTDRPQPFCIGGVDGQNSQRFHGEIGSLWFGNTDVMR